MRERIVTPETTTGPERSWLLLVAGILALVVGFGALAGGAFGASYTWDQAVAQDVVTPEDAVPETAVHGPFTMWAQSNIMTQHQLDRTDGPYYSEMPREVPQIDESGTASSTRTMKRSWSPTRHGHPGSPPRP